MAGGVQKSDTFSQTVFQQSGGNVSIESGCKSQVKLEHS
jgi:hypothetical protein